MLARAQGTPGGGAFAKGAREFIPSSRNKNHTHDKRNSLFRRPNLNFCLLRWRIMLNAVWRACRRHLACRSSRETKNLHSLIGKTWVTLEFGNHQYDHIHGYDHVVNIATDVVLGSAEPGYDREKFGALMEEIKPYLRRYDKVNVIGRRAGRTANEPIGPAKADAPIRNRHVELLASKAKQFV
jgi:hypothetical protein